jgi:hypothetical protein
MPAIVYVGYEDDGVSSYKCSECGGYVSTRSAAELWWHCPWCGVLLTHNEEAHTREARERREKRSELKHTRTYRAWSYWFKAWVPNTSHPDRFDHDIDNPSIESFYFKDRYRSDPQWELKDGDDACFAWGEDWGSSYKQMPQSFKLVEYPNKTYSWDTLRRDTLVNLIKRHRGCPMWFGITVEEE